MSKCSSFGCRGFVRDAKISEEEQQAAEGMQYQDAAALAATISITGILHNITANLPFGDYYRSDKLTKYSPRMSQIDLRAFKYMLSKTQHALLPSTYANDYTLLRPHSHGFGCHPDNAMYIKRNCEGSLMLHPMHRPLAPGRYMVTASAPGYRAEFAHVQIPEDGKGAIHNFSLSRIQARPMLQVIYPPTHPFKRKTPFDARHISTAMTCRRCTRCFLLAVWQES